MILYNLVYPNIAVRDLSTFMIRYYSVNGCNGKS